MIAYLATREQGATVEELGAAMWPGEPNVTGKSKLRNAVYIARKWLGPNPATGRDHLPSQKGAQGATYRLEDVLLDADLFRRLRVRGQARGGRDGIRDLRAALDLVTGPPFDQRRPGGYSWLAGTPLDYQYQAMIADVAHTVATHHLAAGEPAQAEWAARVALLAGSLEDTPLLDLVAACRQQGDTAAADQHVRAIMANHDAEIEEDLPKRTYEILLRKDWLPTGAAAGCTVG